jgi:tetratricopeptide (TPR) repeat protein
MDSAKSKVVVIGWHGASWKTLNPLVDAGLLPNLDSLIQRGVVANVDGIGPSIPSIVWTSIATGKLGSEHGILSAVETDSRSGRARLAGCSGRKVKALWNIAMQSGLTAHVAGWLATFPAEPLNGSCTANEFAVPLGPTARPWPVAPRSIHPPSFEAAAAALRLHPSEMSRADLAPLIDHIDEIDQMQDLRPLELADFLARDISMHAIACSILESQPWDLMMIGWHAFDRACHRFMRYAPPRMPEVTGEEERHYSNVVNGVLRFQDMLLGRLIHLAGPRAAFMLVSPAGFRSGEERPPSQAVQQAGRSWYLPRGMLCMAGPRVASDELVHGVTMLDIAPLALALLGLPAAADMPGKLVKAAFVPDFEPLPRIPSWETVPGDCGMHSQESAQERDEAAAALANLFAAGYSEPKPPEQFSVFLERHAQRNLGLLHLSVGRFQEARQVFAGLLKPDPRVAGTPPDPGIPIYLAHSQMMCGDRNGCRKALAQVPRDSPLALLAGMMESHLELTEGNRESAIAAIQRVESTNIPMLLFGAAALYIRVGAWDEAETRLRRAIELDSALPHAHATLAWILTQRGNQVEATEAALRNIELDYSSAFSHFALGLAMVAQGEGDRALAAFEQATLLRPSWLRPRAWAEAVRARKPGEAQS